MAVEERPDGLAGLGLRSQQGEQHSPPAHLHDVGGRERRQMYHDIRPESLRAPRHLCSGPGVGRVGEMQRSGRARFDLYPVAAPGEHGHAFGSERKSAVGIVGSGGRKAYREAAAVSVDRLQFFKNIWSALPASGVAIVNHDCFSGISN